MATVPSLISTTPLYTQRSMTATGSQRWYAVRRGRQPGVYTDWDTTLAQVSGFPGAVYRRCPSMEEAQRFVGQELTTSPTGTTHCSTSSSQNYTAPVTPKTTSLRRPVTNRYATGEATASLQRSSTKWYAVVEGRKPGLYRTWAETQAQVTGCPGAIYRKFDSEEEAQQFLTSSTLRDQPKDGSPVLYTDGSFADGRGGYGVVQEGYQLRAWGRVPHFPNLDNNVAELYAIYRALTLTTGDIWIVTDSRYSISTLTSYRHGATTAYPQVISLIEPLLEGRTIGWRHVPGHSGHHYNEVADQLAAMGATGTEELVQG